MTCAFYPRWQVACRRHALKAIWTVFGISVIFSLSVAAQEKRADAAEPQWEYCELRLSGVRVEGGNAIGAATIRYAVEDGWRGESVEVVRLVSPGRRFGGGEDTDALGKAMAQLGRQGWELIAATDNQGFRTCSFKRRVKE
ncbi:MAG: hypothetical protein HY858_14215 [Candidatus Solibacter usitatus]|nr:hypothetical protein [Candidatus Solibacter usitatus]